jgi:hypothetical protein
VERNNKSKDPAFPEIERESLIGKEHLCPATVMSLLPELPANVMQLTGTSEQEPVVNPEIVQGLQGIEELQREVRYVPAVGPDVGILSGKGIDHTLGFLITI